MPLYHIRITKYADEPVRYHQFLTERTIKHMLVVENPDKECKQRHLHTVFESVHQNDQALRREIRKWFPFLNGNKDYSLKTADEMGWVYISKGPDSEFQTYPIVSQKYGIDDAQVLEWHNVYWVTREQSSKTKNNTTEIHHYSVSMVERPPRKKQLTWTQKIIQSLKDEEFQCTRTQVCVSALTKRVLDEMAPDGKALDDMILSRLVQSIFNGLITGQEREDWKQSYSDKIMSKMTIL